MKALIIGGNRFFGKRLGQMLLDEGHELTLLNRGNVEDKLGPKVKRLEADRRVASQIREAIGQVSWDVVFDQVCFNAEEAAAAVDIFSGRCAKYIYTSSVSVYGAGGNIEESAFDPYRYDFDSSSDFDYGEGKRRAEAVFFRQQKMPVTAVRFPIVVGPDDPTGRLRFHVERVLAEEPMYFPNLEARLSLIHAADAAGALRFLAAADFSGPINAASAEPIRMREFVAMLETKLGRSAKMLDQGGEADHSPYGISGDWFTSEDKLSDLGFEAAAISQWLPDLIEEMGTDLAR